MMNRGFLSAFAAILLSATLVQTAAAYPTTAKKAITTVTGAYRPITLDLTTLIDGTDALHYGTTISSIASIEGSLYFEVLLTGTFKSEGYPTIATGSEANGPAGKWRLVLSDIFDTGVSSYDIGNTIYMTSAGPGLQVGTLTYEGGLFDETGTLPLWDTPVEGDEFRLFTTAGGMLTYAALSDETSTVSPETGYTVLTVACNDIIACSDFDLTLEQDLEHIGPYIPEGKKGYKLDTGRLNQDCLSGFSCGSVPTEGMIASSVPEPANFALMLIGLGLVGLRLSRRVRA